MPPSTPEEEIANLRTQISELQRALEARAPAAELTELRRQLEEAQRELTELRRSPSPAPAPSSRRLDGFYEVED